MKSFLVAAIEGKNNFIKIGAGAEEGRVAFEAQADNFAGFAAGGNFGEFEGAGADRLQHLFGERGVFRGNILPDVAGSDANS